MLKLDKELGRFLLTTLLSIEKRGLNGRCYNDATY